MLTSPPLRVPSERQVTRSTLSVMNRTEPSPITTFTPPPCALDGGTCAGRISPCCREAEAGRKSVRCGHGRNWCSTFRPSPACCCLLVKGVAVAQVHARARCEGSVHGSGVCIIQEIGLGIGRANLFGFSLKKMVLLVNIGDISNTPLLR